jgi:hypothetical protein
LTGDDADREREEEEEDGERLLFGEVRSWAGG